MVCGDLGRTPVGRQSTDWAKKLDEWATKFRAKVGVVVDVREIVIFVSQLTVAQLACRPDGDRRHDSDMASSGRTQEFANGGAVPHVPISLPFTLSFLLTPSLLFHSSSPLLSLRNRAP